MSNNKFKPCHHIEFNTTNLNTLFKITISFTKQPTKPKYYLRFEKYIDSLPPKTDTHRRFRTRNKNIIPVRIFYKTYVMFVFVYYMFFQKITIYTFCIFIYIFIFLYKYMYICIFIYIYIFNYLYILLFYCFIVWIQNSPVFLPAARVHVKVGAPSRMR